MAVNKPVMTIAELQKLSAHNMFNYIDSITEEMADKSDIGGDSEGEDNLVHSKPGPSRRVRRHKKPVINLDFDSEDSVADKDYVSDQKKTSKLSRKSLDQSSSSDDSDPDDYDIPEREVQMNRNIFSMEHQGEAADDESDKENNENFFDTGNSFSVNLSMNWSKSSDLPQRYKNYDFIQDFGSKIPNVLEASPMQIFQMFFTDQLVKKIVDETNLYAQQNEKQFFIDCNELKAFFGILVIMGFHELPGLRMYWSYDENLHVDKIAKIISLKQFLSILRYLHLNDNEKCPQKGSENFDKMYKLRPLLDHLNKTFKYLFLPARELSVDESMVGFKGRSSLKQYMPMKPTKRGFKIWVMTCARTGYMLSFTVYEGKETNTAEGTLGERTVLTLSESYQNKGYSLYFDNFFSTINLLALLLQKDTFACGTFRINRKHYPKDLLRDDKHMKTGESDFVSDQNKGISVCKFRDRVVISSLHDPSISVDVDRTNNEGNKEKITCPQPVAEYNKFMGGVDLFDQYLSSYSISWKSRRWWLKIFMFLLDSAIVNSFITYKTAMTAAKKKPLSHLQFRSQLANELIGNFCNRRPITVSKNKLRKVAGRSVSMENMTRKINVGSHLPIKSKYRRYA